MYDIPLTHEYVEAHTTLIDGLIDDPSVLRQFADGRELPSVLGPGLDERVVEYPWLFSSRPMGRTLDAGSVCNHAHILDRLLPRVDALTIATLKPEQRSFPERAVSYVYCDLRQLPFRDDWFDTVISLSTLEHVGMQNDVYGDDTPRADDPYIELELVAAELRRVLRPGGTILLSVPYGHREDHGWFRQLNREDVEALISTFGPAECSLSVFAYASQGWRRADLRSAANASYSDAIARGVPAHDGAPAARAVVCAKLRPS
jgi:SAM-dependent methyltransferase